MGVEAAGDLWRGEAASDLCGGGETASDLWGGGEAASSDLWGGLLMTCGGGGC